MPARTRSYSQQTLKRLWALSGNECYMDGCGCRLAYPEKAGVLGEIAHIRAFGNAGPRADETITPESLNSFENLILLCPTCHTIVDSIDPESWTSERLEAMKRSHEDRRHDEDLSGDDLDWVIEFVTLRFTSADRGSSPQGGAAKATQQEPSAAPARNSLRMNLPIVSVTLPSADARQRLIELVAARTTTLDEPRNEDLINDKYRTSLFDGADTNDDLLEWVKQSLGAMGLDPEDCDVKYRAGF